MAGGKEGRKMTQMGGFSLRWKQVFHMEKVYWPSV